MVLIIIEVYICHQIQGRRGMNTNLQEIQLQSGRGGSPSTRLPGIQGQHRLTEDVGC